MQKLPYPPQQAARTEVVYNSSLLDVPHETQCLAKQASLDPTSSIPICFATWFTDRGKQLSLKSNLPRCSQLPAHCRCLYFGTLQ